MSGTTIVLIAAGAVLPILLITVIASYNKLVKLRLRVKNAWSQIEVQFKKRFDLIPNLVETVKGFAAYEKGTFEKITEARARVGSAQTTEQAMTANRELGGALSRLLAVTENYPELKANANFMDLQQQLKELEGKIAFSRQFYNDTVMKYNEKVETFPGNVFARMFNFKREAFFEAEPEARAAPKIKF